MYRLECLVLCGFTLLVAACSSSRSGAMASGAGGAGGAAGPGTAGSPNAGTGGGAGAAGASGVAGNSGSGRDGAAGSGSGGQDGGSDVGAVDSAGGAGGDNPCPPFEAGATRTTGDGGSADGANVNGCDRSTWSITAEYTCDPTTNFACGFCGAASAPCAPQNAIDGDPNTRYTDGRAQMGGEYVILHFGAPVTIDAVEIDEPTEKDRARGVEVEYSVDGVTFVPFCPAVAYMFIVDVSPFYITFPQFPAIKAVKITQTGQAADGSWWSINELAVHGCR
jgi:hypothetical protein